MTLLTYVTNQLTEELDNLINTILFAKKNTLHPSVITPIQLIQELMQTYNRIPNDLVIPVALSMENAHTIMDLVDLQVYYKNGKIIFIINIPLTKNNYYNLYHVIPLPIPHSNESQTYVYTQPNINYLAVSRNHESYASLEKFEDCKIIIKDHYLCKSNNLYNTDENAICEISFLIHPLNKIPKTCNTRFIIGNVNIYHKLKFNQWIIVTSTERLLNILCERDKSIIKDMIQSDNEIEDVKTKGTALLTLKENCKGYLGNNEFIPESHISIEFRHVMPNIKIIKDNCCTQDKLHINHENIQLNPIKINKPKFGQFQNNFTLFR